ncbi:MAG: PDDEXK nuclease domain-containing protein [Planctomycetota bacterium]
MRFDSLVKYIGAVDEYARRDMARAVNVGLTLRNWAIGLYISRYELDGEDRAQYGDELFDRLADRLKGRGVRSSDRRQLYRYRDFYQVYPRIVEALSPEFAGLLPAPEDRKNDDQPGNVGTLSPQSGPSAEKFLNSLSYSHFEQLVSIEDPFKRAFYEVECIRGLWSVRELKRQIGSLYFERSALSKDKAALGRHVASLAEPSQPGLVLRDPMIFEFLDIRPQDTMLESDLEHALLDKLEQFLLELGRGFCFEARQKRILMGGEHFFIDLVFYHRILKCHVLVELKIEPFSHENLGQLNTYLNWYRDHEMADGDSLPVGILLCTNKNDTLVKYALAGMDNQLFVSRYQVSLPDKHQIEAFIQAQLKKVAE